MATRRSSGSPNSWRIPGRYPVLPRVKPGELTDALPAAGPEHGEPMEQILADFERLIVPGDDALEPSRASWRTSPTPRRREGILGELFTAALNGNGMLWKTVAGRHRAGAGGAALAAAMERAARGLVRPDLRHGVHQQHARDRRGARSGGSGVAHQGRRARGWWSTRRSSRTRRSRRARSRSGSGRTTCARSRWTTNFACVPTRCARRSTRIWRRGCGRAA